MEETTSFKKRFAQIRNNLYAIEALEFGLLSFLVGAFIGILMIISIFLPDAPQTDILATILSGPLLFLGGFIALLALWGVYLLYIVLARAGGVLIDVGLWVIMSVITGSFTLWCWTILDLNRLIVSKLFYRGEAPVEYAWSHVSKRRYKEWKSQQNGTAPTTTSVAQTPAFRQGEHIMASRTRLIGTWISNTSMDIARQQIQTFFWQNGMKIVSEQAGESIMVTLEQGSQATTRVVGALFVDPAQLPKQATIRLSAAENGVSVDALIGETLGIGLFDPGTQKRYEDYFRRWMDNLMVVLPPVEGAQSNSLAGVEDASPALSVEVAETPAQQLGTVATPAPMGPSVTIQRTAKSRGTAFALEILLGLLGVPGIGWIYGGRGTPGVILLASWMMWNCIALVLIVASSGIALLCTIPLNITMVIISALLLNNYMKLHPEVFST